MSANPDESDVMKEWESLQLYLLDSKIDTTGWSVDRHAVDTGRGTWRYEWVMTLPERGHRPPYMAGTNRIDLGATHRAALCTLHAFSAAFGLGLTAAPKGDVDDLRRERLQINRLRREHERATRDLDERYSALTRMIDAAPRSGE